VAGTARSYDYLNGKGVRVRCSGVTDISEKMLEEAARAPGLHGEFLNGKNAWISRRTMPLRAGISM